VGNLACGLATEELLRREVTRNLGLQGTVLSELSIGTEKNCTITTQTESKERKERRGNKNRFHATDDVPTYMLCIPLVHTYMI
jgi:hypothetical protein